MSEDRLEQGLQEMKDENVDAATLEAARARVWGNMANAASTTCAEFREDFHAYLANELSDHRRLLLEDHLSRCPGCRTRIAELKGDRRVLAMPVRLNSGWFHPGALVVVGSRP